MSTTVIDLEALERDYQERKAKIRANDSLSWEKQEKAIKALGDEFRAQLRLLGELHEARVQGRVMGTIHVENATTSGSMELNINRKETM